VPYGTLSWSVDWAELDARELILECAKPDNTAAWSEFIRRYHPLIRAAAATVARRWGQSALGERDDLIQEIYLKLCAHGARALQSAREMTADAVPAYLKVVAVNAAHDYFRARAAQRRGGASTEPMSERHEARAAAPPKMEERVILRQLDDILDRQTQLENGARDRAIFRLHYREGMTAKEIAAMPGIDLSIKGVEAVIHRLTARIHEELAVQGTARSGRHSEAGSQ